MNKSGLGIVLSGALMLGLASTAQATLFDRGGGMIYDSDQDLTWLQDANYAVTSGYAAANAVDSGSSAYDNVFTNGRMGWDAAKAWAASLTVGNDRTWTDPNSKWRLPITLQPDSTCGGQSNPGGGFPIQNYGYNCTGSELGHLFYDELGGTAGSSILSVSNQNLALFSNVQSSNYWSGTEYAPNTGGVWIFGTDDGYQTSLYKYVELYAWAVRSGDVAGVPEPATLLLFGLGLAGLGVARRGQSQR